MSVRGLIAVAALVAAVGGCAWMSHSRSAGVPMLDRAEGAPRAAASRDTLRALLSARAELAKLREELTRLREDLARRDGELVRVRQEAERLKADLEKLKQVDLKLERRK
jgi:hypothetical protein